MLSAMTVFDPDPGAADCSERFQPWLYSLGGRYAAFMAAEGDECFYLDPMGSLSCVYSPAHEIVCSTPGLVPYSRGCGDDRALIDAMGIPETEAFFAFGLTPRRGVERLLPNHYLDLSAWRTHRHWLPPAPGTKLDTSRAVTGVSRLLKNSIAAVIEDRPAYLSLTAGFDTRVILACARSLLDRMTIYTFELAGDATAELDCLAGRHIAARFGLDHAVLPHIDASEHDQMKWLHLSGCCVSEGRGRRALRTCRALDPRRVELVGVGGEVGRVSYWLPDDAAEDAVDPGLIVSRLLLPAAPEVLRRCRTWLDGLETDDFLQILDTMYIEQRLGCWGGVLPYADPASTAFRVYPYCHREIIDRAMRLPAEYRRRNGFPRDIIEREWPDLLDVPFNQHVGARGAAMQALDGLKRAGRLLKNPSKAMRKIKERSRRR
jgi:hypothetical protein